MNQEFINRLLIACGIFIVAIKFVAPLLHIFWESISGTKKKSKNNIDSMILQKMNLLKETGSLSSLELVEKARKEKHQARHEKSPKKTKSNQLPNTLNLIKQEIELCRVNDDKKDKYDDLKKSEEILESTQWGTSPSYTELRRIIYKSWNHSIEVSEFPFFIKKLLDKNVLEMRISEKPPHFKEILQVLNLYIAFELINENDSSFLTSLGRKFKCSELTIKRSVYAVIFNLKKKQMQEPFRVIFKENFTEIVKKDDIIFLRDFICESPKFFRSPSAITEKIQETCDILSSLEEYEEISGNSKKALKLMGLKETSSKEEIKKRYKRLAVLKHPDKLTSLGLPDELMSTASKNFVILKEAYELLINLKEE